jgi:3-hydroxyacyl-CoA dehydrogenase
MAVASTIQTVAVIGSGVMGGAIAAHMANAGVQVLLFDIVPPGATDRHVVAKGAIDRMLKTDPAPFMLASFAKRVVPCNLEDDLSRLGDADWIIEAVLEDIAVKHNLYETLEKYRRPGAAVTSNTSTIPLHDLVTGRGADFRRDFFICHFFNPPRYMRLLELVTSPETDPVLAARVRDFCDRALGKSVVRCHDRPGFIGNRIGVYWLQSTLNAVRDLGMSVEDADAVIARPLGIPKTGVFGLLDLIGLDLMPKIATSLLGALPAEDAYVRDYRDWPLVEKLIADGYTGRKGKGGFYRLNRANGGKVKETLDLVTGDYRPESKSTLESVTAAGKDLKALVNHPDKGGQLASRVLVDTLGYAASLIPEIADDVVAVDEAMRAGYGWKFGPFELIDQLGADWLIAQLTAAGRTVPALLTAAKAGFYRVSGGEGQFLGVDGTYHPIPCAEGVLRLSDIKRAAPRVAGNGAASLWDIGDGVLCLEFHSKMNALDDQIFAIMRQSHGLIDGQKFRALVIYNDGSQFSVGANLGMALFVINIALWPQIEALVREGQETYRALKFAPFPVVGAPSGMALGGGCEILLHCDAIQAHAESYIGLVEVGVGLVPAWGGCKEMLIRHHAVAKRPGGPMPPVAAAFETIATAKTSKSAFEAKELLYLRRDDGITMNRDRVLADAKARALALLLAGYTPPKPVEITLPGPSGRLILDKTVEGMMLAGKATPHDGVVTDGVAAVLSGGDDADITNSLNEQQILDLERQVFMGLVKTSATIDRIEHMLMTGKPLRN